MVVRRHASHEGMLRERTGTAQPGEETSCSLAILKKMLLKRWTQHFIEVPGRRMRDNDHKVHGTF